MQNDDMIWQVINKDFCSFKVRTQREDMCRNEYNVSGKCNRVSCPLANSNYATVTENKGHLFLCLKTVERAHLPRTMWERITLPSNVDHAKDAIEKEMKNLYKNHQIERCKRRAVRLKQMLDRMRRIELKSKEKLVPIKRKTERREATREKKAEVAAHLEDVIESELMRRLQQGVYGHLYNREMCKTTDSETAVEEESALSRAQSRTEKTGYVTIEYGTDDEELLESDSEADDEVVTLDEHPVTDSVSRGEDDVEDLALSWDTADPRGDYASAGSRQAKQRRLLAEENPVTEYNCKRVAACAGEAYNSIVRTRPRFFEEKRVFSVKDKAAGNIPISYEDEGECLHI